jgi:hypothetical protein
MFVLISHHHCKAGQVEVARERLDKTTAGLSAEPGFLFRCRLEQASHPNVLSALTAWTDEEAYERNRQKRFGGGQREMSATPYERIEHESYTVHAPAGKLSD